MIDITVVLAVATFFDPLTHSRFGVAMLPTSLDALTATTRILSNAEVLGTREVCFP
jgi:hypothetical protein